MRMGRFDWLAQFFRPTKRRREAREKRPPKEPKAWRVTLPGARRINCVCHAFTKSEARAMAKREWLVSGRLPVGTVVELVK